MLNFLHDACWVGEGEDGGQKRENVVGVHHKLETASQTSGKMFVELPIDVAVVASVEVLFHVALILLLVDPLDDVLMALIFCFRSATFSAPRAGRILTPCKFQNFQVPSLRRTSTSPLTPRARRFLCPPPWHVSSRVPPRQPPSRRLYFVPRPDHERSPRHPSFPRWSSGLPLSSLSSWVRARARYLFFFSVVKNKRMHLLEIIRGGKDEVQSMGP